MIDKPLLAQCFGIGFTALFLKALILIFLNQEVVIMEPNTPLLITEIIVTATFLIINIKGFFEARPQ